jgi:uncharacterized membrane protein
MEKARQLMRSARTLFAAGAPRSRLFVLLGGALLAWYGAGRRGVPGMVAGVAGVGLAARAVAEGGLGRALGLAAGRRGIDVRRSVRVRAPRDRVFEAWSEPDNVPRFLSMVEHVRPLDGRRSRWVVKGPLGTLLEWDSTLTDCVAPELLSWRSEPGAPVEHAGIVHFQDDEQGGTLVTMRLSYHPPRDAVGHTVTSLLGRDPRQTLEADLAGMKAYIEDADSPAKAAGASTGSGDLRAS